MMNDETRAVLAKFSPMRIVLRKKPGGVLYEALTEETFFMAMSDTHALIWWSGPAYSILGTHTLDGVYDAKEYVRRDPDGHNMQIFDPLADDCPVEIDWGRWLTATSKYDKRNAPFKLKVPA